jgi:hypothetical protein
MRYDQTMFRMQKAERRSRLLPANQNKTVPALRMQTMLQKRLPQVLPEKPHQGPRHRPKKIRTKKEIGRLNVQYKHHYDIAAQTSGRRALTWSTMRHRNIMSIFILWLVIILVIELFVAIRLSFIE